MTLDFSSAKGPKHASSLGYVIVQRPNEGGSHPAVAKRPAKKERWNALETTPDPREQDARASQTLDPESGASDDPRVDPTPDKRQSDTDDATRDA